MDPDPDPGKEIEVDPDPDPAKCSESGSETLNKSIIQYKCSKEHGSVTSRPRVGHKGSQRYVTLPINCYMTKQGALSDFTNTYNNNFLPKPNNTINDHCPLNYILY